MGKARTRGQAHKAVFPAARRSRALYLTSGGEAVAATLNDFCAKPKTMLDSLEDVVDVHAKDERAARFVEVARGIERVAGGEVDVDETEA